MYPYSMRGTFGLVALLSAVLMANATSATIVDVDATEFGRGNPLEVFLPAGPYTITPIGQEDGGAYDSYLSSSSSTCTNVSGCRPTRRVTGWLHAYSIESENLESASTDGSPLPIEDDTATAWNRLLYPNASLALANAVPMEITLSEDDSVRFFITETQNALSDNSGGVSLNVTLVPLPASVWLLVSGLACLGTYHARNRSRTDKSLPRALV
jgi:hypothetical protein